MSQNVYGIDIGTSNLKIFNGQTKTIINEKNIIAIRNKKDVFAIGNGAFEMYEQAPDNIVVSFPIKDGVIADIKNMKSLIEKMFIKLNYPKIVRGGRFCICLLYTSDIGISTDIIVGFPGETEEDFNETLDVVKKVQYDSAFTFIYSKRSGTPAAEMENQVPQDVVCLLYTSNVLPKYICDSIEEAMPYFGKKIQGFDNKDTVFAAIESRTSSPVRIIREDDFQSVFKGVYPVSYTHLIS